MVDITVQSKPAPTLITGTWLVFLTLKLLDKIDWSWWWVSSPLWGTVVLATLVVLKERR